VAVIRRGGGRNYAGNFARGREGGIGGCAAGGGDEEGDAAKRQEAGFEVAVIYLRGSLLKVRFVCVTVNCSY
jgi:hypothetical protein